MLNKYQTMVFGRPKRYTPKVLKNGFRLSQRVCPKDGIKVVSESGGGGRRPPPPHRYYSLLAVALNMLFKSSLSRLHFWGEEPVLLYTSDAADE